MELKHEFTIDDFKKYINQLVYKNFSKSLNFYTNKIYILNYINHYMFTKFHKELNDDMFTKLLDRCSSEMLSLLFRVLKKNNYIFTKTHLMQMKEHAVKIFPYVKDKIVDTKSLNNYIEFLFDIELVTLSRHMTDNNITINNDTIVICIDNNISVNKIILDRLNQLSNIPIDDVNKLLRHKNNYVPQSKIEYLFLLTTPNIETLEIVCEKYNTFYFHLIKSYNLEPNKKCLLNLFQKWDSKIYEDMKGTYGLKITQEDFDGNFGYMPEKIIRECLNNKFNVTCDHIINYMMINQNKTYNDRQSVLDLCISYGLPVNEQLLSICSRHKVLIKNVLSYGLDLDTLYYYSHIFWYFPAEYGKLFNKDKRYYLRKKFIFSTDEEIVKYMMKNDILPDRYCYENSCYNKLEKSSLHLFERLNVSPTIGSIYEHNVVADEQKPKLYERLCSVYKEFNVDDAYLSQKIVTKEQLSQYFNDYC